MAVNSGPNIVEDGLVFYIDPANTDSYVSGSETTFSLFPSSSITLTGSLVNNVSGSMGDKKSFSFDGASDYISLGSSVDLGKNHTISFWLYYPANGIHIVTGDPGLGNDYGVFLNNGNNIYYRTTVGYTVFTPTPTLNAWTHLVFTKKDSDTYAKMYLNGVEGSVVGGSSSSMLNGIGKFNTIGAKPDGSSGFPGQISIIQAYNRELSAQEVKQNFNALNRFI